MNNARFKVVTTGNPRQGADKNIAVNELVKLFGITRKNAEALISGRNTTIKKDLARSQALKYKKAVEKAGLECRVERQTAGGKKSRTPKTATAFTCPKCGHTCGKSPLVDDGACPACGIIVGNYLRRLEAKSEIAPQSEPDEPSGDFANGKTEISGFLPMGFVKGIKWFAMAVGVYIFVQTGISVFETPTYEIIYKKNKARQICPGDPLERYHPELASGIADTGRMNVCLRSFRLDIFNAGMKIQPQTVVRIRLPEEDRDMFVLDPIFLDFDRNVREVRTRRRGDIMSYALGPLEVADHVALRMKVLVDDERDKQWDDVFETIDVAAGDAVEGESPKITFLTRLVLSAFNWGAKDNIEKLADVFLDTPSEEGMALNDEFEAGSADLEVDITTAGVPETHHAGQRFRYRVTIRVFNHGPGDAENVELAYSIPESAEVMQHGFQVDDVIPKPFDLIKESKGGRKDYSKPPADCESDGDGSVTCPIERLPPEKGATVFLMVIYGGSAENYSAGARSGNNDPDESDNAAELTVGGE